MLVQSDLREIAKQRFNGERFNCSTIEFEKTPIVVFYDYWIESLEGFETIDELAKNDVYFVAFAEVSPNQYVEVECTSDVLDYV